MKRVLLSLIAIGICSCVALAEDQVNIHPKLKCYDQLIGTWTYEGPLKEEMPALGDQGAQLSVKVSWAWILNGHALESEGTIEANGNVVNLQKNLIGYSSTQDTIIEGGLQSVGGYTLGTTVYDADTKTWTTKYEGEDGQGRKTSATLVIRLTDSDTFVLQAKDRQGGDATGDSKTYEFVRKH